MEHVVFFPAPDGAPAFRRVAGLDEAVRLVEHLRNVEGVESASVHSLTEVPLAFRAYYKVEVPGEVQVPEQATAAVPAPEPVAEAPVLALVEDVPAPGADGSETDAPEVPAVAAVGTGSRPDSLGFFA